MTWLRLGTVGIGCLALVFGPARARAAPPSLAEPTESAESSTRPLPRRARAELITGGVLLGLGFAAELSGAIISTGCTPGKWCEAGFALAIGQPNGPNRYTLVSTGPSSTYVAGRLLAAPLLVGGFSLTMVGVATAGPRGSSWSRAKKRQVAWSLFGAGLGVLVASRVLRAVFLSTGTCQAPTCVHGFDQTSLWIGRGLTFAGSGLLVQGAAKRLELGVAGGPTKGFGLSLTGRF